MIQAALTEDEAKKLAAGAFGAEMGKFPLQFCKPIYFGIPPSPEHPVVVNSATASLFEFRDQYFALTCSHVLEGYRHKLAIDDRCRFNIGNCGLDPLDQLVMDDQGIDVAIIHLSSNQRDQITYRSNGIGKAFYRPDSWPPGQVKINDFVVYGGFPGDLRLRMAFDELSFGTYSVGGCRVTDLYRDYLTCQFERELWIKSYGEFKSEEPKSLGGLSGGPAFAIRQSPAGLINFEFAGLIYKMHEESESLFIRQAAAIPLDQI